MAAPASGGVSASAEGTRARAPLMPNARSRSAPDRRTGCSGRARGETSCAHASPSSPCSLDSAARTADPEVRVEEPEALLYLPKDGKLRLVAIEHVQLIVIHGEPYRGCGIEDSTCPPANPPPAPSLYDGVVFDGPMAGHVPEMPWHYDLHAWIWADNPAGMFAPFNPALSCE